MNENKEVVHGIFSYDKPETLCGEKTNPVTVTLYVAELTCLKCVEDFKTFRRIKEIAPETQF